MQYSTYPNIPDIHNVVATTGFFDGVHLGHKAVLSKVVELAGQLAKPSCVITFWPHPRIILQKDADKLRLLTTLDEKRKLIADLGIEHLIVIPFTEDLSRLSTKKFFNNYLVQALGVSHLIVGYDHHFGKGGQTDFLQIEHLGKQAGVTVQQVQANSANGTVVSSSKIREALINGDITFANQCLGYTYMLSGTVVHGKKLGRKMGFPTANIQVNELLKLLPQDGIYAVELTLENQDIMHKGMLSIGIRPTIDDKRQRTIEVNIFDFDQTIYGETITVRFITRLRNEEKFESIEALRQQLIKDKIDTLKFFDK